MATLINHTVLLGELVLFSFMFLKYWSPESFEIDLQSVLQTNMTTPKHATGGDTSRVHPS